MENKNTQCHTPFVKPTKKWILYLFHRVSWWWVYIKKLRMRCRTRRRWKCWRDENYKTRELSAKRNKNKCVSNSVDDMAQIFNDCKKRETVCVNEITYDLNIVNNPQNVTRQTKPQKRGKKIEKKGPLGTLWSSVYGHDCCLKRS